MSKHAVLQPLTHRGLTYKNRVVLSPMTRGRANSKTDAAPAAPNDLHVEYYTQRASGGAIITEATGISSSGLAWYKAPGLYTDEHVTAWRKVTDSVHAAGGLIMAQLWHMGRAGHSDVFGTQPVSASALPLTGQVTAANHEKKPYEVPHALTEDEIKAIVQDYQESAKKAMAAGFDGVEIHAGNGYLIDQFLQTCSNTRTDQYGGSAENRARILKEIIEAVLPVVDASRIWVRLSPNGAFQEMGAEDNLETFDVVIREVAKYKVGCIEVMDGLTFGFHKKCPEYTLERTRGIVKEANPDPENSTLVMGNVGHTRESANEHISAGNADLISFGRPYISNPDLPERFRDDVELAPVAGHEDWWNKEGADGYTSFPRAT